MPHWAARLKSIVRDRGLPGVVSATLSYARTRLRKWSDGAIDRRYGLDTQGILEPENLDHVGEHGESSAGHEPIQVPLFYKMMAQVKVDYRRTVFIDFGSGKGRAIILAAHFPFKRIVGVEFSPTLEQIARQNVRIFRHRQENCPEIEIFCQDAATCAIPNGPLVCFFYNPFGPSVLNKVLHNLSKSFAAEAREIIIIYRNPVWAKCFESFDLFRLVRKEAGYHLYRVGAAP